MKILNMNTGFQNQAAMKCYRTNPDTNPYKLTCRYQDVAVGVQFKFDAYINDIKISD